MDRAALLSDFTAKVDLFAKYQSFIDKAQGQAARFAPAVIEKVVSDNTEKSMVVVTELIPLTADMDEVIASLHADRQGVLDGVSDAKFQVEEMELRHAIGELDDDEFDSATKDLRAVIGDSEERVSGIDEELSKFESVVARWTELGTTSGFLAEEPEPEPEPEPEGEDDDEDLDVGVFDDADASEGVHTASSSIRDDVSIVFEDDEDEAEEIIAAEADDSIDILADDDDDEGLALAAEDESADEGDEDEQPRRAVLLYQEGTAEEQIYPFSADTLSLGRGRDNDIQVRNDSKVSRYHCKLYRRGPNFYIEDNKSANGTLVNGELVSERRLFGGEEIIIGETFFRFRIMD